MKHRTLLSAAAFAYRPFNSEILCKDLSGFEAQWFRNEDTDTEVIILTGKGDCIVAFRGTEIKERKDIKTDLRFWPCRFRSSPGFCITITIVWRKPGVVWPACPG